MWVGVVLVLVLVLVKLYRVYRSSDIVCQPGWSARCGQALAAGQSHLSHCELG